MLTRLIYYSKSTNLLKLEDINQILRKSGENNAKIGVTGCLYFNENFFIQILEGGRSEVSQLYSKISVDPRNSEIVLVEVNSIEEREFADWGMLYLHNDNVSESLLRKYCPGLEFDPNRMSGANLLNFALRLKNDSISEKKLRRAS